MLASPVTLFVNPFPSGLLYVSGHDYKSFYNLLTQLSYQRSYRSRRGRPFTLSTTRTAAIVDFLVPNLKSRIRLAAGP